MPEDGHPLPVTYDQILTREQRAVLEELRDNPFQPPDEAAARELYARHIGSAGLGDVVAEVHSDQDTGTVTLHMDARTAAVVLHAVRLMCADYEGHAREVRRVAAGLPSNSYMARNRIEIADRQERVANRLRVVERRYQEAVDIEWWGI